jgi:hypothetical protein
MAFARQQLGKHVPAATNIHSTAEVLGDVLYNMFVSYQIFNM